MRNKTGLLFSLMAAVFFISNICFAETSSHSTGKSPAAFNQKVIGIFVETPAAYANNETIQRLVMQKANSLFPANRFTLLPLETTSSAIKFYHSANRIPNLYSVQPLTRDDIQKMAKELNCDYAFFITLHKGLPSMSADFNAATYKTSIACDIRLLQVQNGNYITNRQLTTESNGNPLKSSVPADDAAYYDALDRTLTELHIDTSRL